MFQNYITSAFPNLHSKDISSYQSIASECNTTAENLLAWTEIICLDPASEQYVTVGNLARQSKDGKNFQAKNIYRIIRKGEPKTVDSSQRFMLWHGTKPQNIPGILERGLLPGGGKNPGRGIYFAEKASLSMSYTTPTPSGKRYLVLAEVTPGKICQTPTHNLPTGYDTIAFYGLKTPFVENTFFNGALVPAYSQSTTQHSNPMYIIFNPERVVVKFLVEFLC